MLYGATEDPGSLWVMISMSSTITFGLSCNSGLLKKDRARIFGLPRFFSMNREVANEEDDRLRQSSNLKVRHALSQVL